MSLNEERSERHACTSRRPSRPTARQIAYFSERDCFSIDMFLADGTTGQVQAPAAQAHLEQQLRDLPVPQQPGRLVARREVPRGDAAGAGKYDDIIILEPKRNKTVRRITVKIDGLTTPSWSPDGKQLVFTGYDGGFSDLFIVNARRLRPASGSPTTSTPTCTRPGRPTASRSPSPPTAGPSTNFEVLSAGNFRIGAVRPRDRRRHACSTTWTTARTSTRLVARRQVARVRLRPERREQPLPLRLRAGRHLPAHPPAHRRPRASRRCRRC